MTESDTANNQNNQTTFVWRHLGELVNCPSVTVAPKVILPNGERWLSKFRSVWQKQKNGSYKEFEKNMEYHLKPDLGYLTAIIHSSTNNQNDAESVQATISRNRNEEIDQNQRIKNVVFGYIRKHTKSAAFIAPLMIKYLVAMYFYENDKWSQDEICFFELGAKGTIVKAYANLTFGDQGFAYLSNTVHSGVHSWKFKVFDLQKFPGYVCLRRKGFNPFDLLYLSQDEDLSYEGPAIREISRDGPELYKQIIVGSPRCPYTCTKYDRTFAVIEDGGTLTMIADFKKNELRFRVNNVNARSLTRGIAPGEYVAGFEFGIGSIDLLCYSHIY